MSSKHPSATKSKQELFDFSLFFCSYMQQGSEIYTLLLHYLAVVQKNSTTEVLTEMERKTLLLSVIKWRRKRHEKICDESGKLKPCKKKLYT